MGREDVMKREEEKLILCCRDDHDLFSSKYLKHIPWYKRLMLWSIPKRPLIHFDVSGFNVLWWNQDEIELFKNKLKQELNVRLKETEKYQIPVPTE